MTIKTKTKKCIEWIKNWFENDSGGAEGVILGISGGKDSAVVAALCAKAIGKDKVFGVLMPNGIQGDLSDSLRVCDHLGIKYKTINIKLMYDSFLLQFGMNNVMIEDDVKVNILPRVRMTTLYAIGQHMRYRVAGTGNLSERYVGYFTKWGDGACDFNPIGNLTTDEVVAIGLYLGLPEDIVNKPPSDGLWGSTDEERLGVTYEDINGVIKNVEVNTESSEKIKRLHRISEHKLKQIPIY